MKPTRLALLVLAAALALPAPARADDFADIRKEIVKRHDEAVQRLRDWIAAPAVPLTRLSSALTATTRPARSSTARPMRQVFAPVVSPERGKEPAGSTCTNGSSA